jgi:electron transfer flavoprotein beta subunit
MRRGPWFRIIKERGMNIVVFVKRVPDTESKIRIQHDTASIVEEGLSFVISPNDEYAVEEGLRLREARGGKVTAVSLGGDETLTVLRKALAMGVDEAVLIKDDRKETYDGLRVARILAAAVKARFADSDLLLFGRLSVGADNAQVPAMTAELLGWPQATVVTKLAIEGQTGTAEREIEGAVEKVAFALPAVVSAQKGLNEPRYETLKGIMAAKKKTIPVVTPAELGLRPEDIVPRVEILGLNTPPAKAGGRMINGTPEEAARELVRLLREEAKVI